MNIVFPGFRACLRSRDSHSPFIFKPLVGKERSRIRMLRGKFVVFSPLMSQFADLDDLNLVTFSFILNQGK